MLSVILISLAGCVSEAEPVQVTVRSGAGVLVDNQFKDLSGLRVGLVTNQTARVDGSHLIDLFNDAPDVNLVALFGPEHGLRGNAEAGAAVTDDIDDATGVPVFSLYGTADRPAVEMLIDIDALVFDIQDIGARFYTYISTMGRSMQAAAESDIPFFVLDRPNPLGGVRIEGFVRDTAHVSGVGLYPIPIQHGLTVGELALMIKGESFLPGLEALDLRIIRMQNWHREMLWSDLGWEWIPTSPNIPSFETALVYAGTCLFEGTIVSEGRGTLNPFLLIGAPWMDAQAISTELNGMGLPGVRFSHEEIVPKSIPGMADHPKFVNEKISTVRIHLTSPKAYAPVANGIAILAAIYRTASIEKQSDFFNSRWMGLLAGTDRLEQAIEAGIHPVAIAASWQEEIEAFRLLRSKYLRYD